MTNKAIELIEIFIKQHGWNLSKLAEECGYNKSYITHIIKGRRPINFKTALKFEEVLGVDAETLLIEQLLYDFNTFKEYEYNIT